MPNDLSQSGDWLDGFDGQPTMYFEDGPPTVFEPLLDRILRDIEDLTDAERELLLASLRGRSV